MINYKKCKILTALSSSHTQRDYGLKVNSTSASVASWAKKVRCRGLRT